MLFDLVEIQTPADLPGRILGALRRVHREAVQACVVVAVAVVAVCVIWPSVRSVWFTGT